MSSEKRGAYVVVEGPEFSGKTSNSELLAINTGALWIREPGFTEFGKIIRNTVLNPASKIDPMVELVLIAADKAITLDRVTKPALNAGKSVVSDRSWLSTVAYQCYADGVNRTTTETVIRSAFGTPDLVDKYLILDIEPETAAIRAHNRAQEYDVPDRFESQGNDYHARVRKGYLEVAAELGERAVIIDANGSREDVFKEIFEQVGELLIQGVAHE